MIEQPTPADDSADDLLRRALLDGDGAATAAVAMKVPGLALCEELTIIFHGRRDLSTIQTYVAHGGARRRQRSRRRRAAAVPCDLDLADAEDRADAETLYVEQARALRDALLAADTVLAVWPAPARRRRGLTGVRRPLDPGCASSSRPPPDARCPRRPRVPAHGRPRGGAPRSPRRARRSASRLAPSRTSPTHPLPEDPERCLEDPLAGPVEHARASPTLLFPPRRASVERFLELSKELTPQPGAGGPVP